MTRALELDQDANNQYSLRGKVFARLREDILNGRYEENEELKEVAIGKELGVSRTPVREAFRQLELEGLIQIIPNKGAYVTGITPKDVHDIYMPLFRMEGSKIHIFLQFLQLLLGNVLGGKSCAHALQG